MPFESVQKYFNKSELAKSTGITPQQLFFYLKGQRDISEAKRKGLQKVINEIGQALSKCCLNDLKEARYLNITQLAKAINVNPVLLMGYVNGSQTPSLGQSKRIEEKIQKLGRDLTVSLNQKSIEPPTIEVKNKRVGEVKRNEDKLKRHLESIAQKKA